MESDGPAAFWSFLEDQADACAVVTRRMNVLYLNAPARSLVPKDWFGKRCWAVFPVNDAFCAARCPAIRAVSRSDEIVYCEEKLDLGEDAPLLVLGVAAAAWFLRQRDNIGTGISDFTKRDEGTVSDIKDEAYTEFYQFISHDSSDPTYRIHFNADAPLAIQGIKPEQAR